MSQYLVIPRMEVINANAQPAWWIIGPPPVTAYAGFAQALALAGAPDGGGHKGAHHDGVAVVHHDIQFLGEIEYSRLSPHQYRAASFINKDDYSSKNPHVLASQPTARCHISVSLVIRFDDDTSLSLKRILRFLRGGKLAGGAIVSHGQPVFFKDDADIETVTKIVGSGFSIIERQDLMDLQENDNDMLDVILRLTKPVKKDKMTENQKWLMPTTLGYAEITERSYRRNVRNGLPHAYAEPLVGLVQYRSIREAGLHFWRYTHPKSNVHVVSTN